jgi:Ca2+-binding RTX toxin-like protein
MNTNSPARRARRNGFFAVPLAVALSLVFAATASAVTRNVAVGGTDAGPNDCTASACATVAHAVSQANPGDTIQVGAGTVTGSGQVTIDKNLTLSGAGKTQTVLRPGFDVPAGEQWFRVNTGNDFDVNDLTFDGNGDGGDQVHFGIRYFGSSTGTIDSVGFEDITGASQYLGIGVSTNKGGTPDASSVNLDITNSTFQDIQRVGVLYKGADVTGTFSGNTYTGKGTGDFLDYALDISAGADIDVTGNTITNNRGVAASDGSTSAGFLVTTFWGAGTDATFAGNTIVNNTAGIHVGFDEFDASTATASGNRLVGNDDGVVTTSANVDAQDNWWGCNSGPGNAGCDSVDSRDGGVIDTDPRIVLGAGADPASIETGGQTSQITADVSRNSAGNPVSAGALNGLAVGFATNLGSVSPASPQVAGGTAVSTLTSGAAAGTANVTATLDNQTANTPVTITEPPPPPPPPPADPGTGTDGDDDIGGTDGDDVIDGLGGDDDLFGGEGNDLVDGGAGNDVLDGGTGDDEVLGGEGDDEVSGGTGDDEVLGGQGNDDVNGGEGGDEVRGGTGDDDVSGGKGDDDVKGGQGNDDISGGPGEDGIGGGSGDDSINSHDGDADTIRCGPGDDQLNADSQDEYGPNCENVS